MKNKAAVALGLMRVGVKEKTSERKRRAILRNLVKARSVRRAMVRHSPTHKRCPRCEQTKPIGAFYVSKGRPVGWCKWCSAQRNAQVWQTKPKRRGHTEADKARWREAMRRHRRKYPEREKARAAISRRMFRGTIVRPTNCQRCGEQRKVQAHHADYSKPLDVLWLCSVCHREQHRRVWP
jgi:uncharacterized protein (DUF983 family)